MSVSILERIARRNYSKIEGIVPIPNLIEIQKRSYADFLQTNVPPDKRQPTGLHSVFKGVFPIRDFGNIASLEFVSYHLDKPKYD